MLKSEVGVIYMNDFNRDVIGKILRREGIEFTPLFDCSIFAYISADHPLAGREKVSLEDLADYPCLSFEQGNQNSFYFAEEVLSTLDYRQVIKANDRATMLNLMQGLHGYTLCSGIICNELNGDGYTAVPFKTDEIMTIGYIKRADVLLNELGKMYVDELKTYKDRVYKV